MRQVIPFSKQCVYPGCQGAKWEERDLEICGGHARQVLDAMRPEVKQRAETINGVRISDLETIVARQQSHIRFLETERDNTTKRAQQPAEGVVYYLRIGGYIKIGWTSDLAKRMRSYAPDTTLLATEPGTRKDENRRHRQFATHRTHGREWYALAPALTQHIDRVVKEHGQPEQVAFAAQPVTIPRPHSTSFVGGPNRGNGGMASRSFIR